MPGLVDRLLADLLEDPARGPSDGTGAQGGVQYPLPNDPKVGAARVQNVARSKGWKYPVALHRKVWINQDTSQDTQAGN